MRWLKGKGQEEYCHAKEKKVAWGNSPTQLLTSPNNLLTMQFSWSVNPYPDTWISWVVFLPSWVASSSGLPFDYSCSCPLSKAEAAVRWSPSEYLWTSEQKAAPTLASRQSHPAWQAVPLEVPWAWLVYWTAKAPTSPSSSASLSNPQKDCTPPFSHYPNHHSRNHAAWWHKTSAGCWWMVFGYSAVLCSSWPPNLSWGRDRTLRIYWGRNRKPSSRCPFLCWSIPLSSRLWT